ncbi:MAG TPA: helix-turn-helix domain-containing protein [Verrucomicrobiae bacterium]|jgi:cytoskeleton protein RodZ|nr:helix-turn-helix domain-containing protein [Verrucomicrobiae bacterium]
MPTVAEQLRAARETQSLKIHEVADMTKIRGDHIRALEAGNYEVFSAPVYIRGFVRTYAGLLKLDVQQTLDALNKELAQSGHAEPALSPPQVGFVDKVMFHLAKYSRRMALPGLLAALVVSASVVGYFVWMHSQTRDPLDGLSTGAYQGATTPQTLPLPLPAVR